MHTRTRLWGAVALTVLAGLALALRLHARQRGLLYPDGYQYLLMARGIGEHLRPTVQLGPGGELFVPSVDAALKPLFPALVAALSPLAGMRVAADALTAVAGAATVVLTSVLAGRLTGSRAAALVAGLAALASPALAHWSGFTGPDPPAQALALATALALTYRRATLTGIIGALCAATRPEWALVLAAAGLAGLAIPAWRPFAGRALVSGAFVLAAVLGLLRPPLAVPFGGAVLLVVALAAGTGLQLAAHWAAANPRRATCTAAIALCALALPALVGRAPALAALARDEWPLFLPGAAGTLYACASGRARPAMALLVAVALVGASYVYRNAGSERYLAQLVPLVCVAAGFAAAAGGSIRRTANSRPATTARLRELAPLVVPGTAIALVLVLALTAAPRPRLDNDAFAALAGRLALTGHAPLVSAAPDAYGYLLPGRPQRTLRSGARGLILLDGAQRAYAPAITAHGLEVARFRAPAGFERPDGRPDLTAARLVRGVAR